MPESDLYEPIRRWLESPTFAQVRIAKYEERFSRALVTAELRWMDEGGEWLRPDVVLLNVFRRKYDAFPTLEVHAIEVKRAIGSLTSGFHQALSYSRIADFCYLAAPKGAGWTAQIAELAERFGVGLIQFADERKWETFDLESPRAMTPDPDLRDTFIDAILYDQVTRQDVLRAMKLSE